VRDSVYTIRSEGLGTLTVAASRIQNIRMGKVPPSEHVVKEQTVVPDVNDAALLKHKKRMTDNKAVMSMIRSLQADPDFQAALKDPEIMKAVQSGDVSTLLNNPAFLKLLNKAAVYDIIKKSTR